MRLAAIALLGACWGGPAPVAPPRAPAAAQGLEAVAIGGGRVLFLAALPDGTVAIKRNVDVPFTVESHAWISRGELAVLGKDDQEKTHAGTIGAVGFREVPMPRDWPAAGAHDGNVDRDAEPRFTLRATPARELWLSRCLAIVWAQDGACIEWAHARLLPTAAPPQAQAPAERPAYPLAKATAPPGIQLEVLYHPPTDGIGTRRARLHCTIAGRTRTYPDDNYPLDITDITWLSREPPVFRITKLAQCLEPCPIDTTFEGCQPSPAFEDARLAVGPDGAYALFHDKLVSVRRGGEELGRITLPDVTQVSFAPPP